jgi:ATP-dependent DNA ligase
LARPCSRWAQCSSLRSPAPRGSAGAQDVPPPRSTRFGSPLVLSRVHWVEPKLVAEITYLTWTADSLLRHTVYVGLREDKPAKQGRPSSSRRSDRVTGANVDRDVGQS